jgi:predicted ABC-type ATPase
MRRSGSFGELALPAPAHDRGRRSSGKRQTRYFPVTAFGIDAFNIDDRCAQILGSYRAIPRDVRRAVAKECERFVLDHIERKESFAVETTLRTTAAIDQAELARKGGFATDVRASSHRHRRALTFEQ